MKVRNALMVVVLALSCVIIYQLRSANFHSLDASEENEVTAQYSTIDPGRLDRGALIVKTSEGDADSAYKLFLHYDKHGVPEAAFYWLGVAMKLGRKDVSQKHLDYYESQIMDEFLPVKRGANE